MLPETHKRSAVGEAALQVIGAVAGYVLSKPVPDFGVDFDVKKIKVRQDGRHYEAGCVCQIQLKSSANFESRDDHVLYDLEAKTYNDMVSRNIDGERPLILVLMALRGTAATSIEVRDDEISIGKSLYWFQVSSKEVSDNTSTVRIRIPASQKIDTATFADFVRLLDA